VRFILDAQLPPQLAPWLSREFAITPVAARDLGLAAAADSVLFEHARQEGAAVLTKDSDFVELLHRLGAPPQIIWITCGNVSNQHLRILFHATFKQALQLLQDGESLIEISDIPG
jgi:predicted nuclease of predicted toxin-antitoxin system